MTQSNRISEWHFNIQCELNSIFDEKSREKEITDGSFGWVLLFMGHNQWIYTNNNLYINKNGFDLFFE